MSETEDYQSNT